MEHRAICNAVRIVIIQCVQCTAGCVLMAVTLVTGQDIVTRHVPKTA